MLWKKESRQVNALYVDVFPSGTQHLEQEINSFFENVDQLPHPEKSDTIALQKRGEGNEIFHLRAWLVAMEMYSDSLRYANPGSQHISLAYANRAACFLNMKMYDECLIDIDLAIAADYPEHLMPKLEERKAKCLNEMQENPQLQRKLSIEPNEKFPYLSNVAKVQRNGMGDYSVLATKDIDVGQPIVVEDAHYTYLYDRFEAMCSICLKEYGNLVPCDNCAAAMFCPECHGHFLHKYECGLNFCGVNVVNSGTMGVIRDVLLILNAFKTVDELMVFVERMLKKPNELPNNLLDDQTKFQALFNNAIDGLHSSIDEMAGTVYPPYKTILKIPHVNKMFKSTKHRRFLMHLIAHQASISGHVAPVSDLGRMTYRIKTIMQTFFQQSCCSNVQRFCRDGKTVWYSVKSIKTGEQLVLPKVSVDKMELMKDGRGVFNSKCQCHRCNGKTDRTFSPAQRKQLTSDPAYRFFQANKHYVPIEHFKSMMDACVTVLRKYGEWNWCDQIQQVLHWLNQSQYFCMVGEAANMDHPFNRELAFNSKRHYYKAKMHNLMQRVNNM